MKSDTKTKNTKRTVIKMLVAMLIGGVIGGVSSVVYENVLGEEFGGGLLRILTEVTQRLMVPGLLLVTIVSIAAYEICFKKLKNIGDRIGDAEDEEFQRLDYEEERYGAILQCINVVAQVLCIVLLGSGYSMKYIHDGRTSLTKFLTACVLFLICFFYSGMAQARYVKLLQKVHPEKKGDVTSKDFHKQWLESCDEAEKEAVYQSSYSTYIFTGKLIGILLVVTMIAHLFFNTGVFAILVVGAIYLCMTVKYCISCVRLKSENMQL